MKRMNDQSDTLEFDFSTAEGHELTSILEQLIFDADPASDVDLLETIYERLRDEVCLAQWKRENVLLDLSMCELVELNHALLRAGGSSWASKFQLTGELRCCLIAASDVDRVSRLET